MKEKLEKNKKEQEFKEQKRKKDLIEMEEILKKKETLAQKAKKEEKPQNEPKVIVDKISTQYIEKKSTSPTPQKKGPPNFASFMKNLKGKNTDVLITNETTVAETSIISTSSSIEKKTEAKIKIPPPPTKSAEINEKPVIVEEKGIDKPKISTIIQKSAELNPTEQEQKNSLSHNIEEESKEKNKDKDKIQEKEKNTISEITEKEITIEKTNIENINVQTKTEEISEGKKESNDEIYEKKNKIGQVKIEKKFIKMHNRFKKL